MATTSLGTSSSAVTSLNAVEASASGTAAVENVVNLTFNGNDSYSMTITLNNADEASATSADQEISISNIAMTGNDATAIASAINNAIAGNESAGKSTLLESLIKFPLFPRDMQFCTRIAIHVRLRRPAADHGIE